jgi:hypothetical protein
MICSVYERLIKIEASGMSWDQGNGGWLPIKIAVHSKIIINQI